jgi:hypothetical protein
MIGVLYDLKVTMENWISNHILSIFVELCPCDGHYLIDIVELCLGDQLLIDGFAMYLGEKQMWMLETCDFGSNMETEEQ